jgi:hypothetical protein
MTTLTQPVPPGASDPALLLGAMQRTATETLGKAMDAVLRQADDYLFDHSQGGGDLELTALRDLRRARAQIAQGFEQAVVAAFRRLAGIQVPQQGPLVLSLLDDDGLEERLANEQIADGLVRMHAPAIDLLEKRLAALLERVEVTTEENPVSPSRLAQATHAAVHAVEVSTGVRIVLYKLFEREFAGQLTPLYERLNGSLAAAGILPNLKSTKRAETQPPPPRPEPGAAAAVADAIANDVAMSGPVDPAMFSSLVGLLQSWRQSLGGALAGQGVVGTPGTRLAGNDMLSVLSQMQSTPPPGLQQALNDKQLSLAEQLRREVLAGARRLGMGGDNLNLADADEDAVDLVGMLFDVMLDERHFEPDIRSKIGRMLVPYVKVAVRDRRMFLYRSHPARRLLNAVAEACEGNHGDAPQERELLDRVDGTIDRLVAEYNEDLAIFETLEQELRAFMDQHRKRFELAERRAADAQRGRERLDQARESVSVDLTLCCDNRALPPVLDAFVNRFVHHHLTQLVLRDGQESPRYAEALHAVRGLLFTFDAAELGTPAEALRPLEHEALLAILASSGCVGHAADEALATIQEALRQLAAGEDAAAHDVRLPEQTAAVAPPPPAPPEPDPALRIIADSGDLDFDPAVAERIRDLVIGTWVQLTSESGRVEPAKVSWISPISSRLLFVNRRGVRVLVASAEELAAMAKAGTLQLREADNAFDDAMHQMINRLKSSAVPA